MPARRSRAGFFCNNITENVICIMCVVCYVVCMAMVAIMEIKMADTKTGFTAREVKTLLAALGAYDASCTRFLNSPKFNDVVKAFYRDEAAQIAALKAKLSA